MSDYSIYPKAIDGFAQIPLAVDRQSPVNAEGVNRLRSGIINIENTLGVAPHISGRFGDFNSVGDRITNLEGEHSDLADIVSELADPTLDIVYHFGQSILMDNGPINLTGNDYFMFNDESGAPVGAIDAGSSLRILSSGTDLVLNAGGEEKDVILRPGALGWNEDLSMMIPGTIRVESSDVFSVGSSSLNSYMVFGESFLSSRAMFIDSNETGTFTLAVGFGSMLDSAVVPYGLELTVLEHSAPDTPGRGIDLSASPGTGTESGGPIRISSGKSSGAEGASARFEGATGTAGGRVELSAGAKASSFGGSLELAGGNSPKGGSAFLAAGAGDNDPGGEAAVRGGDSEADNGGDLFLQAGGALGGAGGDGGTSHIHAGSSTSGTGGNMQISAGDSDSNNAGMPGGDAHFIGGNSEAADGGNVNIDSGDSVGGITGSTSLQTRGGNANTNGTGELSVRTGHSLSGDTGALFVESGATQDNGPDAGNSGGLRIASGNTTMGNSGGIQMSTGATTDGNAGSIDIFTGDGWEVGNININTGSSPANTSGDITIQSGAGPAATGQLLFRSGDADSGNGSGEVFITSGGTTDGGDSGSMTAVSGPAEDGGGSGGAALESGPCDGGGPSGPVGVKTGDSIDANGNSGSLHLMTGQAYDASGEILIQSGNSTTANPGDITLNSGSAPNAGGSIFLNAGDGGTLGGDVDISPGGASVSGEVGSVNILGKTNILGALALPITTWTSGIGDLVFTAGDMHFTILVDSQIANTIVLLPDATTHAGRIYNVKRIDNPQTIFTPRVADAAGNDIDGFGTKPIGSTWSAYTFQSNGAAWFII